LRKPVAATTQILGIFRSESDKTGIGVNEIYRRTGSKNKPSIIRSIQHLERCQFLETGESKHKQRKVKVLTTLGCEVVQLLDSIDKYNTSYSNFTQKIEKYVLSGNMDEDVRNRILISKGWTMEEAENYDFFLHITRNIEFSALSAFINSILARYLHLILEFNVNLYAKTLIIQVIVNALDNQLSLGRLLNKSDRKLRDYTINEIVRDVSDPVYDAHHKMMSYLNVESNGHDIATYLNSKIIKDEAVDLMRSTFSVLKPSTKTIPRKANVAELKEIVSGLDLADAKKEQEKLLLGNEFMYIRKEDENDYTVTEEDGQEFHVTRNNTVVSIGSGNQRLDLFYYAKFPDSVVIYPGDNIRLNINDQEFRSQLLTSLKEMHIVEKKNGETDDPSVSSYEVINDDAGQVKGIRIIRCKDESLIEGIVQNILKVFIFILERDSPDMMKLLATDAEEPKDTSK
jgi:hypothetical protein